MEKNSYGLKQTRKKPAVNVSRTVVQTETYSQDVSPILVGPGNSGMQILSEDVDNNYISASDTEVYNDEVLHVAETEVAQLQEILRNSLEANEPARTIRDTLSYPTDTLPSGNMSVTGQSRQGTDKQLGHFSQTQQVRTR